MLMDMIMEKHPEREVVGRDAVSIQHTPKRPCGEDTGGAQVAKRLDSRLAGTEEIRNRSGRQDHRVHSDSAREPTIAGAIHRLVLSGTWRGG